MQIEPAGATERQEIVVDTVHDLHEDHSDPQQQTLQQNL